MAFRIGPLFGQGRQTPSRNHSSLEGTNFVGCSAVRAWMYPEKHTKSRRTQPRDTEGETSG